MSAYSSKFKTDKEYRPQMRVETTDFTLYNGKVLSVNKTDSKVIKKYKELFVKFTDKQEEENEKYSHAKTFEVKGAYNGETHTIKVTRTSDGFLEVISATLPEFNKNKHILLSELAKRGIKTDLVGCFRLTEEMKPITRIEAVRIYTPKSGLC